MISRRSGLFRLFDYQAAFQTAVEQVKGEGRYRVFADLKRVRGEFPKAIRRREDGSEQDVIVWCSNDYLGMGQDPDVIATMKEAVDTFGAGSGGGGATWPRAAAIDAFASRAWSASLAFLA